MATIKDRLDARGLEIARRAQGREFTREEREELHFIGTLATWYVLAQAIRKMKADKKKVKVLA